MKAAKIAKTAAFLREHSDGHAIHETSKLNDAARAIRLFVAFEDAPKSAQARGLHGYARLTDKDTGRTATVPVFTRAGFERLIGERGKGGSLAEGDWQGVSGLDLARALAELAGVTYREAFGMGSQFRFIVEALAEAGKRNARSK